VKSRDNEVINRKIDINFSSENKLGKLNPGIIQCKNW